MTTRHLPAVVAAVLSGVVILGAGLATRDDSGVATETSASTGSTSTTATSTTSTTATDESSTTTSPESTSTTIDEPRPPVPTTAPTTSTAPPRPGATTTRPPPPTSPAPTTTLEPARFTVVSGPNPSSVGGCTGTATITVRNVGGVTGIYGVRPRQPSWASIAAPQLTLAPDGESTAAITVDGRNGSTDPAVPTRLDVDLINQESGAIEATFAIGVTLTPGFSPDCQR